MMEEKILIKGCLKGNRDAQKLLYASFAPAMLGICYRYTKSLEDAEDVLQEGFIKVFTKLDQFKEQGNLGGWIRKIMVNTAINYLNKHQRYKKEMMIDDVLMHPVSDERPDIMIETKELIEMIRKLPVGYQVIFNLVAIEGYAHTEISDLMNMNINTIRSKYSRARTMMMTMLKEDEQKINKTNVV